MTEFNGRAWLDAHNFNTVVSRTTCGKFPLYVACGHDFFDQSSPEKVGPMSKDEACVIVGSTEWTEYLEYKESRKHNDHGSLEAVQWLLASGAVCDLSVETPEGNTPLRLACYNGNLPIVKLLYSAGAQGDVSKPNKKGSKPMSAACYEGHIHIVKFLLECGCEADLPGPQYHSTTHMTLAAQNGHVELMKFLYENGCQDDVNHVDERGMVPMMYAAQQDNMDVLEFLYAHGGEMSVSHCRASDGVSSLGAAIASGKLEIVQWFLKHGANATGRSLAGCSPMIIASQGNGGGIDDGTASSFLKIMQYLYDNGAEDDVDAPMDDGSRPIHYAAYNGDVETANWLKSLGVDLSIAARDSRTPMLCAAMTGSVRMLDYLFYNGAESDLTRFYFGGTYSLIHIAAANGRLEALQFLIDRSPSSYPFLLDETGSDGFLNACAKGKLDVVRWWYERFNHDSRFNIHRRNHDDDTAMYFAVEAGSVELCQYLYEKGCVDISKPIKHGCITLLQVACKECHLDLMRWLGDKGAVKNTPGFPYMEIFGKRGPSFMHTTCSKGAGEDDDNVPHFHGSARPTYGERLRTQRECLRFCFDYGATLDDMSMPFPDPATMSMSRGKEYHGHIPLGMSIVNGHLPSVLYLLRIGATRRRGSEGDDDEHCWMECLAHERTDEEEKALRLVFPPGQTLEHDNMQEGVRQLNLLAKRYSSSRKRGTLSCPQGMKEKVLSFAQQIVDSHQEYHTFLLCTHRASAISAGTGEEKRQQQHVLEPFGRAAFRHVRKYVRDCLIVKDDSRDQLQRCYGACLRLTMRFGLRCGACGKTKPAKVFRCCTVVYCSKECQASHWARHRKTCDRRKKKNSGQKGSKEKSKETKEVGDGGGSGGGGGGVGGE